MPAFSGATFGFCVLYSQMFPEYTVLLGFYIGAAFGSFLNVVIYRLPKGMSLNQPPSHCPNCNHRLGVLDLFPLFSFLFAGAKCRYCKAPISWRYFIVEVLTGTIWAAFWWQNLIAGADPARFLALAAFGTVLVACIFIDLFYYIIPDSLNAWLLLIGLVYNAWLIYKGDGWTLVGNLHIPKAVAGALIGVAVFWGIAFLGRALFRKDAMGHGDIKLARGIGAVLFPTLALLSFALAVAVGAVLGIVQVLLRKRAPLEEEPEEPYVEKPESFGSLIRCGIGYALAIDAIALFFPKLDKWWFGIESPEEAEDDWQPSFTTIPFGPYLALGALLAAMFSAPLMRLLNIYLESFRPPP